MNKIRFEKLEGRPTGSVHGVYCKAPDSASETLVGWIIRTGGRRYVLRDCGGRLGPDSKTEVGARVTEARTLALAKSAATQHFAEWTSPLRTADDILAAWGNL